MTTLFELQKYIFTALTSDSSILTHDISGILRTTPPLSDPQRLAIYKDSFTTSLINTLGNTYEVCRKLTGDEFFNAMAEIYVRQTPSLSADIGEYGGSF